MLLLESQAKDMIWWKRFLFLHKQVQNVGTENHWTLYSAWSNRCPILKHGILNSSKKEKKNKPSNTPINNTVKEEAQSVGGCSGKSLLNWRELSLIKGSRGFFNLLGFSASSGRDSFLPSVSKFCCIRASWEAKEKTGGRKSMIYTGWGCARREESRRKSYSRRGKCLYAELGKCGTWPSRDMAFLKVWHDQHS